MKWVKRMRKEIKKQIERIDAQIEAEKKVHQTWSNYKDCTIKTAIINQSIGVVRGLEVAKESLEYLLEKSDPMKDQMTTDEWLIHEQNLKGIKDSGIDYRGGLITVINSGDIDG
jgi:hypothetical protein